MASNQGKHNSGSAAKDMAVWNSPKNKSFWNNTAIQRGIAGALLFNEMGLNPLEGAAIGYFGSDKRDRSSHKKKGLANNDLSRLGDDMKRSDLGRGLSRAWHGTVSFYREFYYHDLGKAVEQNKGCIMDIAVSALVIASIPYLGPVGTALKAVGEYIIPVPMGCRPEGSYFGP